MIKFFKPFIKFARAEINKNTINYKYALKNGLIPVILITELILEH